METASPVDCVDDTSLPHDFSIGLGQEKSHSVSFRLVARMAFRSGILTALVIYEVKANSLTLHPSPFSSFLDDIRALVAVPASQVLRWDSPLGLGGPAPSAHPESVPLPFSIDVIDPSNSHKISRLREESLSSPPESAFHVASKILLSPLFPSRFLPAAGRVILPTCSSFNGPLCGATEQVDLLTRLFTSRGPQRHSLYLQRLRSLLAVQNLRGIWVVDPHTGLPVLRSLNRTQASALTAQLKTADPAQLSRYLMAIEFESADGSLYLPVSRKYIDARPPHVDHTLSNLTSEAVQMRRNFVESKSEIRASNEAARIWSSPGEPNSDASRLLMPTEEIFTSEDWHHILKSASYSLFDVDSPQRFPTKFGSILGSSSPKLMDKLTMGIGWLKSAPFPADMITDNLEATMHIDTPSINESLGVALRLDMPDFHVPESLELPPELERLVQKEQLLMELIPNVSQWKLYAALLKISPAGVRNWAQDMIRRKRNRRLKKLEPQLPVFQAKATVRRLHPFALARGIIRAHLNLYRFVTHVISSGIGWLSSRLAELLGLRVEYEMFMSQLKALHRASHQSREGAKDADSARSPLVPPAATNDTPLIDDEVEVEAMVADYDEIINHYAYPVSYSRYTGTCWKWDLHSEMLQLDDRLPFAFSRGLPLDVEAHWIGSWQATQRGPQLLSPIGELHFSPAIVVNELFVKLEELVPAREPQILFIRGGCWRGGLESVNPATWGKELDKWRLSEHSAVETVFSLTVNPDLIKRQGTQVFDVFRTASSRKGNLMRRVEFLQISRNVPKVQNRLSKRAPRDASLILKGYPVFSPVGVATALTIESMTFNFKMRLWDMDYSLVEKAHRTNGLHEIGSRKKDAAEDLLRSTFEAKRRGSNYITGSDSFPSLVISTLTYSDGSLRAFHDTQHIKALERGTETTKIRAVTENRLLLNEALNVNQKLFASSVRGVKFPVMPGEPIARGGGRVKAAQLALDANIRAGFEAMIGGALSSMGISGDGVLINADLRLHSNHIGIEALDLPVEASVLTIHMMKQYNLVSAFNHERVEYVSFSEGEVEADRFQSDFLKILQKNLEESGILARYLAEFESAVEKEKSETALSTAPGEPRQMSQGKLNEVLESLEEHVELFDASPDDASDRAALGYAEGVGVNQVPQRRAPQLLTERELQERVRAILGETSAELRNSQGAVSPLLERVTLVTVYEDPETGEIHTHNVEVDLTDLPQDLSPSSQSPAVSLSVDSPAPTVPTSPEAQSPSPTDVSLQASRGNPEPGETRVHTMTTTVLPERPSEPNFRDETWQGMTQMKDRLDLTSTEGGGMEWLENADEDEMEDIQAFLEVAAFLKYNEEYEGDADMDALLEGIEGFGTVEFILEGGDTLQLRIPDELLDDEDKLRDFLEEELVRMQNLTQSAETE
eukprot:Gregarina_sp_Poly_1__1370@NODE_133_length_13228_cov_89_141783_g119_i0_p1_GENE_NODE_133_length_13228_cov_89_141783_g119_i0NODE_133_length_13228_cov_89_141783_g119_i0_p1_ORF_typecomplete_len1416_score271_62Imm3/PF14425_6/0_091Cornifin/PF02389_15/1_5_NODE_133_length_13228_cov_89_141783_g119_i049179164